MGCVAVAEAVGIDSSRAWCREGLEGEVVLKVSV